MNINGAMYGCNWSRKLVYHNINVLKACFKSGVHKSDILSKLIYIKNIFSYVNTIFPRQFYKVWNKNTQKVYCMKSHVTSAEAQFAFGAT